MNPLVRYLRRLQLERNTRRVIVSDYELMLAPGCGSKRLAQLKIRAIIKAQVIVMKGGGRQASVYVARMP